MTPILRALAAVLLLALAPAARADCFFVVVFGAETEPKRPKYSHSWATFVRIPGPGPLGLPGPGTGQMEVFTISWLPEVETLRPLLPVSEPGRNFDLPSTMRIVLEQCERVAAWGPYQITEELYCRARQHRRRLECGEIRYKTIDIRFFPTRVSNCIHALTVFNTENRRLRVGRTNFGHVASYYITDSYRDWIVNPCQVHCWIADLLGLGQYPIHWHTLQQGDPRRYE